MLESDWEFYASTLFFVCLCCCFTALCGYTEVRRKKKGISFAEAWSVPQAMPILRTWPGRSLSSSDMMPGEGGQDQDHHWAQLSDSEEDLKKYPVAGLVDDSGVAFGFVASMPQYLLGSLAPPMTHPDSTREAPPGSQMEPELTIRIPRARGAGAGAGAAVVEAGDAVQAAVATRAEGFGGTEEAGRLPRGGGQATASTAAVGNDLQEPLIFGDGTAPGRRDAGVEGGGGAGGGVVEEGENVAEGGRYRRP